LEGLKGVTFGMRAAYEIAVGSGGITLERQYIEAPVVGLSRHYVADSVEVNALVPAIASAGVNPNQIIRVAACAALGRPSAQTIPALVLAAPVANNASTFAQLQAELIKLYQADVVAPSNGWTPVSSNLGSPGYSAFRVPQWATAVEIHTIAGAGAATSNNYDPTRDAFVLEVTGTSELFGPAIPAPTLQSTRSIVDYATPQPLDPDTYFLVLEALGTNLAPGFTSRTYRALVTFHVGS
jgi:hypothetical protein